MPCLSGLLFLLCQQREGIYQSWQLSYQPCLNTQNRYWTAKGGGGEGSLENRQNCLLLPHLWGPAWKPIFPLAHLASWAQERQRSSGPRGGPKSMWISGRSGFYLKRQPSWSTKQPNSFMQLFGIDSANAGTQFGSLNSLCSFDLVCPTSPTT